MNTNIINEYLQTLGFNSDETTIYSTLVQHGTMTILELSRLSGVERTKIYGISENLKQKGIIEEVLDYKRKLLKASTLDQIKLLVNEQTNKLKFLQNSFSAFGDAVNIFSNQNHQTEVKYYRGMNGLKQMMWNQIKADKYIYSLTYKSWYEIVGKKFLEGLEMEFVNTNTINYDLRSIDFLISEQRYKTPSKSKIIKDSYLQRFIDPKILRTNTFIDSYNDVVSIWNADNDDIFCTEIHNAQFAGMFKQMYMVFWNMASKWDPENLYNKYEKEIAEITKGTK